MCGERTHTHTHYHYQRCLCCSPILRARRPCIFYGPCHLCCCLLSHHTPSSLPPVAYHFSNGGHKIWAIIISLCAHNTLHFGVWMSEGGVVVGFFPGRLRVEAMQKSRRISARLTNRHTTKINSQRQIRTPFPKLCGREIIIRRTLEST